MALNVNEYDNSISINLAIETAEYYGISESDAKQISAYILKNVKENWAKLAQKYKLSRSAIDYMRSAFGICESR